MGQPVTGVQVPPPPRIPPPGAAPVRSGPPIRTIVRIVVGVLAVVLLAVVLGSRLLGGDEGSAPPAARAPKALAAARVDGRYAVVEKVTWARGFQTTKAGTTKRSTWTLTPLCAKGACATRISFRIYGALPDLDVHRITVPLRRSGAVYEGKAKASLTKCSTMDVSGTLRVRLAVRKAAWVGGAWTATRLRGTLGYATPETTFGVWRCPVAGYTAALTATRTG